MSNLFIYYSFILVTILTLVGFFNASSLPQLISAVLFFPLAMFFFFKVFPKRNKALTLENIMPVESGKKAPPTKLGPKDQVDYDRDRRMFLKIIVSAGFSLFFFSLFSKKAHGAFFGSVPGPGTVAIKDSNGTVIDPAVKQPTDGYQISQIDESSPNYYGFVDKTGNWYIMKEDTATGNYRYSKGASGFSANWTSRASLTYDYFDIIF